MTNVIELPQPGTITAAVAGNARAELAREKVAVSHLPKLIGKNYGYWYRRISGMQSMDVEDLQLLARVIGCEPADFLPRTSADRTGPTGPGGWAPSGSNRRPTD